MSQDSKPGTFTGIDKPYQEKFYPVTSVVYRIYPLNGKQKINILKTMRHSSLNCVAERIIKPFTNALRGNKLMDIRRNKKKKDESWLTVWKRGAIIQNVDELEKI